MPLATPKINKTNRASINLLTPHHMLPLSHEINPAKASIPISSFFTKARQIHYTFHSILLKPKTPNSLRVSFQKPTNQPSPPSSKHTRTMSTPATTVLASRDVNASPTKASPVKGSESLCVRSEERASDISEKGVGDQQEKGKGSEGIPMSMEQHRQALRARLESEKSNPPTYISPSDNIMSPCTAKLSAYKSKHFLKAKPQSLFAKLDANKPTAESTSGGDP